MNDAIGAQLSDRALRARPIAQIERDEFGPWQLGAGGVVGGDDVPAGRDRPPREVAAEIPGAAGYEKPSHREPQYLAPQPGRRVAPLTPRGASWGCLEYLLPGVLGIFGAAGS